MTAPGRSSVAGSRRSSYGTAPADRAAAEAAAAAIYGRLGWPPPAIRFWLASPAELVATDRWLTVFLGAVRRARRLDEATQRAGWAAVEASLPPDLDPGQRALLARLVVEVARQAEGWRPSPPDNPAFPELPDEAWERGGLDAMALLMAGEAQVETAIGARLRELSWAIAYQLRAERRVEQAEADEQVVGNWMVLKYLATQALRAEVLGRPIKPLDRLVLDLLVACGGGKALDGVVLLLERPSTVRVDEDGRLHAEDGPALAWRDGWRLWVIHGMALPRQAIEAPEKLRFEEVQGEVDWGRRQRLLESFWRDRYRERLLAEARALQAEPTVALRRQLIAEYGVERFVRETGQIIAADIDGWAIRAACGERIAPASRASPRWG